MITFYILLVIPIIFALLIKFVFHATLSFLEMFSMLIVTSIIVAIVYWAGIYGETADAQILNGRVTSKAMERVSCRHDYDCNCRTECSGSGESRSCSTVCDTCYEHSYDQDWDVLTTIGTWTIDPIDRQGLKEPPRWTQVKMNEPVSKRVPYVNYVKAVPESLFNFNLAQIEKFKNDIPAYPLNVYDYYKLDRVIVLGGQKPLTIKEYGEWKNDFSNMLGQIGPSKQVNGVLVFTSQSSSMYAKALQASWLNGKKNDVIIVMGVPEYPKVSWVSVFGWSKNDLFNVKLRDALLEIGEVDRIKMLPVIRENIEKYFVRRPMAEYEYLKDQIEPPLWVSALAIVLALIAMGGLTYQFNRIDLWDEMTKGSSFRRRRKW